MAEEEICRCHGQCDQVNPLNVPNIIENVMQNFDLAEIRAARQVNKTWETEATKFMVKFPLTFLGSDYRRKVNGSCLSLDTLNSFLSCLVLDAIWNPKLVQLYQNFAMNVGPSDAQPWTGFVQIFGPYLKQLTLLGMSWKMEENPSPSSSVLYFGPILTLTPQLTHLALDLGMWNRISWTPEPDQDQHVQLNCLKTLKLLAFRGQLSVYQPPGYPLEELPRSSEDSRRMREILHSIWMKVGGVDNWKTAQIWPVLLNILRGSPNLGTLDLTGWYFLPGSILVDILAQVSTSLTKLMLCSGGTVNLKLGPGPRGPRIVEKLIDYLDLVTGFCLRGGKLKTLKFPRPAKTSARRGPWTKFFSALSPSLVHLDLGNVSVCASPPYAKIDHLDIFLEATRNRLRPLQFGVQMDVLSTLILHISMLSRALTSAMFPALRHLTLVITNLEELESQFVEISDDEKSCSEFEQRENNLYGVSKLTCMFLDERRLARHEPTFKLFSALKYFIPNLYSVELTNWLGVDGLAAFLGVFGGTTETAKKIENLELKTFSYHGHFHTELCHILTGVEEPKGQPLELQGIYPITYPTFPNSLKSFENLKSFTFGVGSTCPYFAINSHFVLNSICQLSNLETLAFENVTIENVVVDEIRTAIPGIRNIHISKCDVRVSMVEEAADVVNWDD